jgi:hypothetical protein
MRSQRSQPNLGREEPGAGDYLAKRRTKGVRGQWSSRNRGAGGRRYGEQLWRQHRHASTRWEPIISGSSESRCLTGLGSK